MNTSNFDDLLADTFNFAATYSCLSDRADGADPCSITNGAQTNPQTLASLSRGTDATNDLVYQLNAKATAVQDITFNVPNLYGTTFSGFKATISNEPLVDTNPQKYRATGDFNVLMLAADDKIEWRGGPENTTKDFDGFTTTDRFKTRDASILTKTRVKAAALATDGTGYYTPNALFTDVSGVGTMSPFRDVGDLADSADADEQANLDGTNDATALASGEMSPSNQFYAVKSFCCGQDDVVTVGEASINCKLSRKNDLPAADPRRLHVLPNQRVQSGAVPELRARREVHRDHGFSRRSVFRRHKNRRQNLHERRHSLAQPSRPDLCCGQRRVRRSDGWRGRAGGHQRKSLQR